MSKYGRCSFKAYFGILYFYADAKRRKDSPAMMNIKNKIDEIKEYWLENKQNFLSFFHVRLSDVIISCSVTVAAFALCAIIGVGCESDTQAPMIFVLSVLIVSRLTSGYMCGVLVSLIAVVGVNYVFTYPYFELNFTLAGYPLTFVTMLAVSLIVSALTSRVKIQESIRLENEKDRIRADLLRALSHDIRTPLTSIGGAASAILENGEKLDSEKSKELLTGISEECKNLVRLVENILSVTKIDDTAHIEKREEIVEEVVSEAVSRFKKYGTKTEVTVLMPKEPLFVPMDAVLIEQVIINLLENAVNHGVTTSEIVVEVKKEDDMALFSVRDNGLGIKSGKLDDLENSCQGFDTGERADTKRNLGMGLSMCISVIRAHGGTMKSANVESGGAEFMFMLPLEE